MTQHAFISHSHRDAEPAAEILAALEQRGVKCWAAPRDVPPGGSYAEAILTAIQGASCFVLVYTENSNVSPHVLREVERALSYGVNIIPVRFDSSNISKSLDYLLATVHWLSVIAEPRARSIDEAAERIASTVRDKSDAPVGPREVPPPAMPAPVIASPPVASPRPTRGGPILLWLGLVLLALAGIIFAVQTVRHSLPKEVAVSPPPSPVIPSPPPLVNTTPVTAIPSPTPELTRASESPATMVVAAEIPVATAAPAQPPPEATSAPTPESTAIAEGEAKADAPEETPDVPADQSDATPAPATNRSHESPLGVVKRYFSYLSDRNTIKAYELLSTEYRRRETFVIYTRSFASTEELRLVSAQPFSTRGNLASISVTFDKKNQKFGWIRWRGPIQLTAEPAGWRINSLKGLKASSIRH